MNHLFTRISLVLAIALSVAACAAPAQARTVRLGNVSLPVPSFLGAHAPKDPATTAPATTSSPRASATSSTSHPQATSTEGTSTSASSAASTSATTSAPAPASSTATSSAVGSAKGTGASGGAPALLGTMPSAEDLYRAATLSPSLSRTLIALACLLGLFGFFLAERDRLALLRMRSPRRRALSEPQTP